ncbi:hypothetical protein [uncultured Ferrovibrio sp.]|jgi:hypothetical protein|uniref:hypothetical protein n=1 Tax=uncultured Ferrovibrio sp. TaxID=1576913 RepID=UPI00260A5292|nr:hypothetical protein [uncultured Ferrovibrio sp.]
MTATPSLHSGPSPSSDAIPQDLLDLIASLSATARDRVFSLTYGGRKLWIKRPGVPRLRSSVLMQTGIARVFALPILLPARQLVGPAGLAQEASAIRMLSQAGFPVPEVVACTDQYLVLGDAGQALEPLLHATRDDDKRWRFIASAGTLLTRLHAAGHWHGGAQIRNFCWQDGQPGLLDLEDHGLDRMTLADRQARDLLLFLYSLTRYDRAPGLPRISAQAAVMIAQASPKSRAALQRLRRRMAWLLALARWIAPHAGRDVRQAVAADQAIGRALAQAEAAEN